MLVGMSDVKNAIFNISVIFFSMDFINSGDTSRSIVISSVDDVIMSSINFNLELHQELWLLRPLDFCFPLKVRSLEVIFSGSGLAALTVFLAWKNSSSITRVTT